MPTTPKSYSYEPNSQVRKPARSTPLDQTRIQPAPSKSGTGKFGGIGKASGGSMNGGGKRRPGHNARYGID